ncbi:hypothetical protein SprV_0502025300 [Sparganum proliferum]
MRHLRAEGASLTSDINPRYIGGSGGIMAAKDDENTHPSPFEPPASDPGASEPPVITSYVSLKADTEADLTRPPLRPPNPFHPGVLATDAACQLDVLRHDCHALGMNGAQVGLEVLSNLTDQALEGQLADQEVGALLVATELTQGDSSGPTTLPSHLPVPALKAFRNHSLPAP